MTLSWKLYESLQTIFLLFFMIKMHYGEISVSEMETGYISLSIFLALQHPSILSTVYMLFLILSSSKKSAPFLLGDYHSQISWSLFWRNNILWCEISLCNLFLCPFYTISNILSSFLVFLSFCCLPCRLVLPTLGCMLPVHLLPHEEKVGEVR